MYLVCKKLRTCKKTIATFVENDYIFLFERIIGVLNQSESRHNQVVIFSWRVCLQRRSGRSGCRNLAGGICISSPTSQRRLSKIYSRPMFQHHYLIPILFTIVPVLPCYRYRYRTAVVTYRYGGNNNKLRLRTAGIVFVVVVHYRYIRILNIPIYLHIPVYQSVYYLL